MAVAGRWLSGSSSCICNQVPVHCLLLFYCFSCCRGPVITGKICAGLCRSSGIDVYLAGARFEYRQDVMYTDMIFMVYINAWGKSRDCAWIRQRRRPLLSKSSPVYPHLCTTDAKWFEVLMASQNKTTENIWWEESKNVTYCLFIGGWFQGALFFLIRWSFGENLKYHSATGTYIKPSGATATVYISVKLDTG